MIKSIVEISPGAWLHPLQPGLDHEVELVIQTKPWLRIDAIEIKDPQFESGPNVVPF